MNKARLDLPLLFVVLGLMSLGIVMVFSASWALASQQNADAFYYLKRQGIYGIIAAGALMVGAMTSPGIWRRYCYQILGVTTFLLVIVLIPGVGAAAGVARRWIALGPFTIQAGEVAKFALVIYLASSFAKKGGRMHTFAVGLLPHVIVPGVLVLLLIAEPDFGTAMMLTALTLLMLFVGGARVGYLAGAISAVVPVALFLVASSPYRMRRVIAFLDPWAHRYDVGYQITESLMTLGSGGISGLGLGDGRQKLFFLPAAHTDFIFAVLGEELGFIGVLCVISAFAVVLVRGATAALSHKDAYASYLSFGLTILLVLQAIFNISVVMGVVPTKGLTLPFMSYGGSSLIASAFMAGVLIRLSGDAPCHSQGEGDEQ